MATEFRTVIDTNVAVSAALLPRSVPRQAFDAALSHGKLLVSKTTFIELHDVLRRTKFDKYLRPEIRLEFLAAMSREAEFVEVVDRVVQCRDPRDDKFLELAVSGNATHIVSGDADLLAMNAFRGIAILTPQEYLSVIAAD